MSKTYDQLFNFLNENEKIYPHFKIWAKNSLKAMLRFEWLQRMLYSLYNIFFRIDSQQNYKFLFFGLKYQSLIESLPSSQIIMLGGGKSCLKFSFKNKIPILYIYSHFKPLLTFFSFSNQNCSLLDREIRTLSKKLQKTKCSYLIVESDSLPSYRLLLLSARHAGIKTICILHGISTSSCPSSLADGQFADYVAVYDHHQKQILAKAGIPTNKLLILGFYESILAKHSPILNRSTICILGQPWVQYNPSIFTHYLDILKWLLQILRQNNLTFVYKPHPAELSVINTLDFFSEIPLFEQNMKSCLEAYDLFISFASTALVEATLHNKLAVQIYTGNLFDDILEPFGYAYTVQLNDEPTLIQHLKCSEPLKFSEIVTLSSDPVEQRFNKIIEEIERQYQNE